MVWLSPIYRSPMDDNGYDISDYQDVDPLFGTLEELDALIAGLHARGIKLIMDLVVNHTSDEHPWFVESRDPASPKRDWYFWRPAREGFEPGTEGAEPTNWESSFSGSAWQFDERSGEYFLHVFSPKQPDLNWENPEVRRGRLRDDELVGRPGRRRLPDGRDQPDLQAAGAARRRAGPGDRRTRAASGSSINGPRLEEFLAEMNAAVGLTERNLLTVGEMPGSTIELARRVTDPARHELNMVFTFEHVGLDRMPEGSKWDLKDLYLPDLKQNLADWQVGLADVGWNSLYWDNHDQPRAVSRFGDDSPEHRVNSAKTLATVQHLHQGTPYVYQGEELGMTNTYFAEIGQYRDIESVNYHADALSLGLEAEAVLQLAVGEEPGQRAYADAVGRHRARRVHRRDPLAAGQPELRDDQRRGGDGRPGLGVPPLPEADRAAARTTRPGRRALRAAAGRPRADLGVDPDAGGPGAADAGQLLVGAGDRAGRCAARRQRRRGAAGHPPGGELPAWSWRPGSHASTCVADAWPASSDGALVSSSAGSLAARARSRNGRASAEPRPTTGRRCRSCRRRRPGPGRAGRRSRPRCRSASRRTGWSPAAGRGSFRSGTPGGPARRRRRPGSRARSAPPPPRSWWPARPAASSTTLIVVISSSTEVRRRNQLAG